MQQTPPTSVPPTMPEPTVPNVAQEPSPALLMARRIRGEQGIEQLKRFLEAMEPFVAPAERRMIAESMGIKLRTAEKGRQRDGRAAASEHIGQGAFSDPMAMLGSLMGGQGWGNTSGDSAMPMMLAQLMSGMMKKSRR